MRKISGARNQTHDLLIISILELPQPRLGSNPKKISMNFPVNQRTPNQGNVILRVIF